MLPLDNGSLNFFSKKRLIYVAFQETGYIRRNTSSKLRAPQLRTGVRACRGTRFFSSCSYLTRFM